MMIVEIEGKQYEIKNTKYAGLVRKLRSEEYQTLKDSIVRAGKLFVRILINEQGHILDGHNRYQICQETAVKARFEVWEDDKQEGDLGEIICVKEANLNRRQMTAFERWEMALSLKPEYERQAKLRMSQGGKKGVRNLAPLGRTDERIAAKAGCGSSNTGRKVEKPLRAEKENPEKFGKLVNQLRVGGGGETGEKEEAHRRFTEAWNEVIKEERMAERRAQLAREAEGLRLPSKVTLLNRDSLQGDIPEIPDNSVDLILTDPAFGMDMLHCYEWLAGFAARKLKLGGSVVFYPGYRLDRVMNIFYKYDPTLQYAHLIAVIHTGHSAKLWELGVWSAWKPFLWFTKSSPAEAEKSKSKGHVRSCCVSTAGQGYP